MDNFLNRIAPNIRAKLRNIAGVLFITVLLTVAGGVIFSQSKQTEAIEVNVSGQQRMLTQRMSKNSLLILSIIESSPEGDNNNTKVGEVLATNGIQTYGSVSLKTVQDELRTVKNLFSTSLTDLTEGNEMLDIPTPSAEVLVLLNDTWGKWRPFEQQIDVVLNKNSTVAQLRSAVNTIVISNNSLLVASDDVVNAIELEALQSTKTLYTFFGVMFILALLALALAQLTISSILRQTDKLSEAIDEIDLGNLTIRAEVLSQDELGRFAQSLNGVLDNTLRLVQTEAERDDLQKSIYSLLTEIADLAEGDLTIEATVGQGVTGAIADSINLLSENLRLTFGRVQTTASQLSISADTIQLTAEQLSSGSELQASQIIDTSVAIDEIAISIQQVSENSILSAAIGEQARVNAQRGAEAVRNTIDGMQRIRSQVQDTSKRIQRLGDNSQRIGEIVLLIEDIADRTSILALNASIQAQLAGEAGKSFTVVAEEVENLAERATQATQQIDVLVHNMQLEIEEVTLAMEVTTSEALAGTKVAHEAGARLTEIESVSERLANLIDDISHAAQQQAHGSQTIAASMNDIAVVTRETASGAQATTSSIDDMSRLADELQATISTFRITTTA